MAYLVLYVIFSNYFLDNENSDVKLGYTGAIQSK